MLKKLLNRFRKDETGTIAVEAVLILPMLTWCYLATFVYFDAFRTQTTNLKAAYTISDAISRETGYITPEYMESLHRLHEFLTTSRLNTRVRITSYDWSDSDEHYHVLWSQEKGGADVLTNSTLNLLSDQLPIMAENEGALLVQTWIVYEPVFSVGLEAFIFENLVVTRPRFVPFVCWNPLNDGDETTQVC